MAIAIKRIRGVTAELEDKLKAYGIFTIDQLLKATKKAKQRKKLAAYLNVNTRVIFELANRAELIRVKGSGCVYSEEGATINTANELVMRYPDHLPKKNAQLRRSGDSSKRVAVGLQMDFWMSPAGSLPGVLKICNRY